MSICFHIFPPSFVAMLQMEMEDSLEPFEVQDRAPILSSAQLFELFESILQKASNLEFAFDVPTSSLSCSSSSSSSSLSEHMDEGHSLDDFTILSASDGASQLPSILHPWTHALSTFGEGKELVRHPSFIFLSFLLMLN